MSKIALSGNVSGTGTLTLAAPNTDSDRTLTLPDSTTTLVGTDATQTLTNKTIQGGALTSATAVSASGTSVDFTGIPSWVKRITVMFNGVSTNGASMYLVQIGSGAVQTTGYLSLVAGYNTTVGTSGSTAGLLIRSLSAGNAVAGTMTVTNMSGFIWVGGFIGQLNATDMSTGSGVATLSGALDRIRITTANGTDTFDAGTINILYEG